MCRIDNYYGNFSAMKWEQILHKKQIQTQKMKK